MMNWSTHAIEVPQPLVALCSRQEHFLVNLIEYPECERLSGILNVRLKEANDPDRGWLFPLETEKERS
jgi:hypothetical protein